MNSVILALFVLVASVLSLPSPSRITVAPTAPPKYTSKSDASKALIDIVNEVYVHAAQLNNENLDHITDIVNLNQTTDYSNFARPTPDLLSKAFELGDCLHSLGLYHRYAALDKNYVTGTKAYVDSFTAGDNNPFYQTVMHLEELVRTKKDGDVFSTNDDDKMKNANILCAMAEQN